MNRNLTRYGQEITTLSGRYQLVRLLGRGGMGEVWLALDTKTQRQVAIKIIQEGEDQSTVDHFLRESRHAASLKHPHILRVDDQLGLHALGTGKGMLPYIVMEYAEHGDLRRRLRDTVPYDFEEALSIVEQIGQALQCAHDHDLLHRDVKPHNILFRANEQAVLSDFGIAVTMDITHDSFAKHGTPAYMALEHMQGHAEKRSDLYSLAVVLYQLLTGQLPDRFNPKAPSTLNPHVPSTLDPIVLSALAPRPEDRPASVQAFLDSVRGHDGGHDQSVRTAPAASPSHPAPASGTDRLIVSAGGASTRPNPPIPPITEPGIITLGGSQPPRVPTRQSGSAPTRILPPTTPRPAPVTTPPIRGGRGGQRRAARKLRAIVLAVCTLLLIGAIVLLVPGLLSGTLKSAPAYSISITPDIITDNNTYAVSAVTGTPDATNLQVQAATLTGKAQSTSQTVNATGQKQIAATYAKGFLTFYNSYTTAYTIARTVITASNGVQVEADSALTVPPGDAAAPSSKFVAATALLPGAMGNIAAGAIAGGCCANGIAVQNLNAFTGGQDAQNYTVVAQSDIDNASSPAISGLIPQAQQAMNAKLTKNLRYAEQGSCTPTISSDHQAGDKAVTVTVQVAVDCQREAYDVSQIPTLVTAHLRQTVAAEYAMVDAQGNRTSLAAVNAITVTKVDPATGTVTLNVHISVLWVYQIPDRHLQAMKAHIARMTVAKALAYLKSQPGVADASIQPGSGTLPTDVGQIGLSLVKQTGPGGSGGGIPSGGGVGGTPVIMSPTAGPIPTQTGIGKG